MMPDLESGTLVRHPTHGRGEVRMSDGSTAIVRFDHGIEECRTAELSRVTSLRDRISESTWDVPLEVLTRAQAEAILSVNAKWGVFTRSRIDLLPHQLWVCREVTSEWPFRWMVADDVGLGKTIEAGMILTSLLSQDRINRLLVLCPASLVHQWQRRLRRMFDIRLAMYTSAADTPHSDFWHTHSQVVVSMHTLRLDHQGRHERLLSADPWDLVVVDESHHLNADEKAGPTLAYQLVQALSDHKKIHSMLFFTGTPHRGKTFGFLSQLQLLRPDLFDPQEPVGPQLNQLSEVVIRNNKQNVTDLSGEKLFREPKVEMETYSYSHEEAQFYETLTEFIVRGRAYASSLSSADASAVMLVLISMQKLASSSVAAIRKAIRGRLARIEQGRERVSELRKHISRYQGLMSEDANDEVAAAEEELAELSTALVLMEDEVPTLRELLKIADQIEEETKITRIAEIVRNRFADRSVLFFTEYKATQSLLMSALIKEYGRTAVTFINGDDRADNVDMLDGTVETIRIPREVAARRFNRGESRFLVSTEAAGEGIDLQGHCHTLIHVDLPWNPMRLHQRVGRLNRYGQKNRVEVLSLRNPDTVESHIWRKLEEKIQRINEAFVHVMDDPEDLRQLVLGMMSTDVFQRLFADSVEAPRDSLSEWFDQRTANFGGEDAVEVVEALVGSVHRFDFQNVSSRIPRVDLPALRPFFESSLTLNGRRPLHSDEGLSFKTPDEWRDSPAVRTRYAEMTFERGDRASDELDRLLGIGHVVVNNSLAQAKNRDACVAALPASTIDRPLILFSVRDRVTDGSTSTDALYGLRPGKEGAAPEVLLDWKVLEVLNELPWRKEVMQQPSQRTESQELLRVLDSMTEALDSQVGELEPRMAMPEARPMVVFWPTMVQEEVASRDKSA